MHVSLFGLFLIVAVLGLALLTGFLTAWHRFSGKRLITCPETLKPAAVDIHALGAAKDALVHGSTNLRLKTCTRWPEREDCGQECLAQIETSADGCLLQTVVVSWYAGKRCEVCQRAVGEIVWHEQPPALLAQDGTAVDWKDVAPQELSAVFKTHRPLCFACNNALAFRQDHKALVVERPRSAEAAPLLQPTAAVY